MENRWFIPIILEYILNNESYLQFIVYQFIEPKYYTRNYNEIGIIFVILLFLKSYFKEIMNIAWLVFKFISGVIYGAEPFLMKLNSIIIIMKDVKNLLMGILLRLLAFLFEIIKDSSLTVFYY